MRVQVVGDVDERLVQSLSRRLNVDVSPGIPDGAGQYVCVLAGKEHFGEIARDDRVSLIVLVEPNIELRDIAVRALAASVRPGLEIVEHVAASIQAERTWALIQACLFDLGAYERKLSETRVQESYLVEGAPTPGSWASGPDIPVLAGLTMGIIGFGHLAGELAHRAGNAGLEVLYWPQRDDRSGLTRSEGVAIRTGARKAGFDDILADADIVVLDLEYGPDSIRIIDAPELALMRRDALLVNTSHGRAIDEGALIQALRAGRLAGAVLDCFTYEPLPADSPMRSMDRLLLTPGITMPDDATRVEETARLVASAIVSRVPEARHRRVRRQSRRRRQAR